MTRDELVTKFGDEKTQLLEDYLFLYCSNYGESEKLSYIFDAFKILMNKEIDKISDKLNDKITKHHKLRIIMDTLYNLNLPFHFLANNDISKTTVENVRTTRTICQELPTFSARIFALVNDTWEK